MNSHKPTTVIDLVCGMELEEPAVKHIVVRDDEQYYFCSISCKQHFINDPERYVGAEG